jgi:tetratricopeptide (TPR) repeat protein
MLERSLVTPAVWEREWIEDLDVLPGQGEILRRIRLLEERVAAKPAEWRLRLQVAQAHASVGDFEASAAHLRACRELVTDPPVLSAVFFNLGVCLESLERWREAADAYEQCLFLLPNLFWGRVHLGRCRMRLGEWRPAVDELRLAVALDDREPEVFRSLRDALQQAGMAHEAGEAHSRLLELGRELDAACPELRPN